MDHRLDTDGLFGAEPDRARGLMRPPSEVMRLARLGAGFPTRLSFLRQLMRRMRDERWQITRPLWDIDANGTGRAVYRIATPARVYSAVFFGHRLAAEARTDRVIATAWDTTFALVDGELEADDLRRLASEVPHQEGGRLTGRELVLSRANRSVRLWDKVVATLAAGDQPDAQELHRVGYLMRTTAVYGAGKFGAADREVLAERPETQAPFQAEMLTVWLSRAFSVDLVEAMAAAKGGARAARLSPELRRGIGIGNATGLGMAPFLVRHPVLLHNWIAARERALALVRALPAADDVAREAFQRALAAMQADIAGWPGAPDARHAALEADLARLADAARLQGPEPWEALWQWGEAQLGIDGQEALLALMLEPHGALVDPLGAGMAADERRDFRIDGRMTTDALSQILDTHYPWALEHEGDEARFWYVSEAKAEPRLGARATEPGSEIELPMAVGRDMRRLSAALGRWRGEPRLAAFLLAHPGHRHAVRRAQIVARHPYAEIRDNLVGEALCPADMLRAKLVFLGASRFDPRSDRWVRVTLAAGTPVPEDLAGDAPP